jgi:hypothetical protein
VDIRSRANTTRGLDYEHMIKARAHKGGVRIGKTPKKQINLDLRDSLGIAKFWNNRKITLCTYCLQRANAIA